MSLTSVACCQVTLQIGDVDGNLGRISCAVEEAATNGAQIVILPELANSGYVFADAREAWSLAEGLEGPTISHWNSLAREHNLILSGGICEAGDDGSLYNSAVIVDPSGIQATYRKVHLWDKEKLVFTPGTAEPPVVETEAGLLSMMICHDAEFPEWVRLAALKGTELLCVPTNWPILPRPANERSIEIIQVQASAATNRMFIAVCDRAGVEREVDWVEGSVIVDCDGWPLAGPSYETKGDVRASLDLTEARTKQINEHNDVHADRRPELYGMLANDSRI